MDIVLRLEMLRPGKRYGYGGDVQTEAQYDELIRWPDDTKPTWAEILALGDIELRFKTDVLCLNRRQPAE